MTPERRRALLLAVFAALAALVAWDRLAAKPDELVEPTRASVPTPSAIPVAVSTRASPVAIARLRPRDDYLDALQAEAADTPPPAIAVAPAPPPPEAPAPPPYRVIGKGRVDGRWEVYLAQANRVVVAHAGDRLDGQYEVVAIVPPTLQLALLPTREPRSLAIGPALDN